MCINCTCFDHISPSLFYWQYIMSEVLLYWCLSHVFQCKTFRGVGRSLKTSGCCYDEWWYRHDSNSISNDSKNFTPVLRYSRSLSDIFALGIFQLKHLHPTSLQKCSSKFMVQPKDLNWHIWNHSIWKMEPPWGLAKTWRKTSLVDWCRMSSSTRST